MTTERKADWGAVIVAILGLLGLSFGVYGKYTADQANHDTRLLHVEKELIVATQKVNAMEDELDVLWVDTQTNEESIKNIRKDQERFDAAFLKFAEATDRLSVSVARIEEHMRMQEKLELQKQKKEH